MESHVCPPRAIAIVALGLAAVLYSGCSEPDKTPLIDVSGLVTFDGRPANAEVVFQPAPLSAREKGGRASSGRTRSDGTFRLTYSESRYGAVAGHHEVLVRILPMPQDSKSRTFHETTTPIRTVHLERTLTSKNRHFTFAIQQ